MYKTFINNDKTSKGLVRQLVKETTRLRKVKPLKSKQIKAKTKDTKPTVEVL